VSKQINQRLKTVPAGIREPSRISKVMRRWQKVWERYPDMRFGQLLVNVIKREHIGPADVGSSLFYSEDVKLVEIAEKHFGTDKVSNFIEGNYEDAPTNKNK